MRNRHPLLLIVLALLLVTGLTVRCGKSTDPHSHGNDHAHGGEHAHGDHDHGDHDHGDGHEGEADDRHFSLSGDLIKQWGIGYGKPSTRHYVEKITLTGVVATDKNTTFVVNTPVTGIVTAIGRDIGDGVGKGDVLFRLNSPQLLEMKTAYVKALQDARLTGDAYRRARVLHGDGALEKKELAEREAAYKTALAESLSLEAGLMATGILRNTLKSAASALETANEKHLREFLSPYCAVRAPGPGKVIARQLNLGQRVEENTPVFEVSDTRRLWVMLDTLEKDLPFMEKGQPITIENDAFSGSGFNGEVDAVMERIDPDTRTVKVRVTVDNTGDKLKPGMYVRGLLRKDIKREGVAVPGTALVKISGQDCVFVIDQGEFTFKPVRVTAVDSDGYAFVEGLLADDMVITSGSFYLKAEYEIRSGRSSGNAHGHSH